MADTENALLQLNIEQSALYSCIIRNELLLHAFMRSCTRREQWPYGKESRHHLRNRRQLWPGSALFDVFLVLVWDTSLAVPPIPYIELEVACPLSEKRCDRRHQEYSMFEHSNCASRNKFVDILIMHHILW